MSGDWRLDLIWEIMVWALLAIYIVGVVVVVVWIGAWIIAGAWLLWEKIGDNDETG